MKRMALVEEDKDLFCEEESYDLLDNISKKWEFSSFDLKENDWFCEDDELESLILKEKDLVFCTSIDGFLVVARKEALGWIYRAMARFEFTPLTTVLAVNYYDRFISRLRFQGEKPWMTQLAAVACLSLAAKIEETQVPLLVDLQVEDSTNIFEAKTIQRMELLVLSALQWRMHPITPLSFCHHITSRLGLSTNLQCEFLSGCARLLLSVIADFRVLYHRPSVLATAVMLHVIREIKVHNLLDYQKWLTSVIRINQEKLDECYKLIIEILGSKQSCNKRRQISIASSPNDSSPNDIIGTTFSCDTSNDSWAATSNSPEPIAKQIKLVDEEKPIQSP